MFEQPDWSVSSRSHRWGGGKRCKPPAPPSLPLAALLPTAARAPALARRRLPGGCSSQCSLQSRTDGEPVMLWAKPAPPALPNFGSCSRFRHCCITSTTSGCLDHTETEPLHPPLPCGTLACAHLLAGTTHQAGPLATQKQGPWILPTPARGAQGGAMPSKLEQHTLLTLHAAQGGQPSC